MHPRLVRRLMLFSLVALSGSWAAVVPGRQRTSNRTELHLQTSPGVVLRTVRVGRRTTRPPLVLISGWTVGLEVWEPVAEELAEDREVILFDSRSQGGSTVVTSANTPEDRGRDLAAILRRLNLSRPILIGWSQGAQDVAAYVHAFGDKRLAGTVLVDAVPSGGPGDLARTPAEATRFFELLALYRSSPLDYQRGMMSYIIGDPRREQLREQLAKKGLRTPSSIGADMLVADLYGVDRSKVQFSRAPLLLIAGRNPGPAPLEAWGKSNHAKVMVVVDSSHAIFVDQPEEFVAAIRGFEAEVDAK